MLLIIYKNNERVRGKIMNKELFLDMLVPFFMFVYGFILINLLGLADPLIEELLNKLF